MSPCLNTSPPPALRALRGLGGGLLCCSMSFVLWLALPLPTSAQDDTAQGAATQDDAASLLSTNFIDTVDVNVINVDVFVTDKDGHRVTGLTQDDFELLVDKRPVAISNFYAVDEATKANERVELLEQRA